MSAPTLDTALISKIHGGVKAMADTLDGWANDETLPVSVRVACIQSQGSLAGVLQAVVNEAEKGS